MVGSCHLHGLSDAEKLLGPLPAPWRFQVKVGDTGGRVHFFHNPVTGENRTEDPRLQPLPSDWEPVQGGKTDSEAERVAWHRNKDTGQILNSDPRLLPEALEKRGVDVRMLQLA